MEDLSLYSIYLELIAAIIGTVRFQHYRHLKLKYVLFYIWYLVLSEVIGKYLYDSYATLKLNNALVYNIMILLMFLFSCLWYRSLLHDVVKRRILLVFAIIHGVFWLCDGMFIHHMIEGNMTYSFTLGTIFLVVAVAFYFAEMLNREVVMNVTSSPYFWVSFGLMIFSVAYLPFMIMIEVMQANLVIWSLVLFMINVIQYCCFSIAFLIVDKNDREHLA
ncbi:MAG: hypothetical protein CL868_14995 [Cytophagaceae bacterium]|nr:hypothetical protein [Cytophagaceae bacterium]